MLFSRPRWETGIGQRPPTLDAKDLQYARLAARFAAAPGRTKRRFGIERGTVAAVGSAIAGRTHFAGIRAQTARQGLVRGGRGLCWFIRGTGRAPPELRLRRRLNGRYNQGARLQPKVIQAILRHSDISVTLDFYLATPKGEAREALDKVSSLI